MLYSSIYFSLSHHHLVVSGRSVLQVKEGGSGRKLGPSSVSSSSACLDFLKFVLILFCSLFKYLLLMPELLCIQLALLKDLPFAQSYPHRLLLVHFLLDLLMN